MAFTSQSYGYPVDVSLYKPKRSLTRLVSIGSWDLIAYEEPRRAVPSLTVPSRIVLGLYGQKESCIQWVFCKEHGARSSSQGKALQCCLLSIPITAAQGHLHKNVCNYDWPWLLQGCWIHSEISWWQARIFWLAGSAWCLFYVIHHLVCETTCYFLYAWFKHFPSRMPPEIERASARERERERERKRESGPLPAENQKEPRASCPAPPADWPQDEPKMLGHRCWQKTWSNDSNKACKVFREIGKKQRDMVYQEFVPRQHTSPDIYCGTARWSCVRWS